MCEYLFSSGPMVDQAGIAPEDYPILLYFDIFSEVSEITARICCIGHGCILSGGMCAPRSGSFAGMGRLDIENIAVTPGGSSAQSCSHGATLASLAPYTIVLVMHILRVHDGNMCPETVNISPDKVAAILEYDCTTIRTRSEADGGACPQVRPHILVSAEALNRIGEQERCRICFPCLWTFVEQIFFRRQHEDRRSDRRCGKL